MKNNKFINHDIAFLYVNQTALSGMDACRNLDILAKSLSAKGRYICETRIIKNVYSIINTNIQELSNKYNVVIIAGNIGYQVQSYIAQCVAQVFNLELEENEEAKNVLKSYLNTHGKEYSDIYAKSITLPKDVQILKNTNNGTCGFRVANVFVIPSEEKSFKNFANQVSTELCEWYKYHTTHIVMKNDINYKKFVDFTLDSENIDISFHDERDDTIIFTANDANQLAECVRNFKSAFHIEHIEKT